MSAPMSAVEENLSNMVCDVVDKFLKLDEETYDDFLNKFSQLKKSDIIKQEVNSQMKRDLGSTSGGTTVVKKDMSGETTILGKQVSAGSLGGSILLPQERDSDELEEEILEEGQTNNRLTTIKTGTTVKFDNFVDTEADEEDDDENIDDLIGHSGYTASFSQKENKEEIVSCCDKQTEKKDMKQILADSRQSGVISPKECSVNTETTDNTLLDSEPCSDLLNPGEIEDTGYNPTVGEVQNQRTLDFMATYREGEITEGSNETTEQEQADSTEVQPFSLDEDFDYDNVVLTPKFTQAQVVHLENLIQGLVKDPHGLAGCNLLEGKSDETTTDSELEQKVYSDSHLQESESNSQEVKDDIEDEESSVIVDER